MSHLYSFLLHLFNRSLLVCCRLPFAACELIKTRRALEKYDIFNHFRSSQSVFFSISLSRSFLGPYRAQNTASGLHPPGHSFKELLEAYLNNELN